MRPVPSDADEQFGVFTTAQARAAGWTSHALRHAVGGGTLDRVRPGVYASPLDCSADRFERSRTTLRRNAAALSVANPMVTVSHRAAATLLGIDLLTVPTRPCATVPRGSYGDVSGAHLHRAELVGQSGRIRRVRVTDPARTAIDVARECGIDAGIVAVDSAMRRNLLTRQAMGHAHERCSGWPGAAVAWRCVALADGRSESALESVSRVRIVDAGLPLPLMQVPLVGLRACVEGRVDFYWEEFGVVGEADGLLKYDGIVTSLRNEKIRQGHLEDAGLTFVRWGFDDLADFGPVVERLRNAFARGLRPDRAPRLWRVPAWYPVGAVS